MRPIRREHGLLALGCKQMKDGTASSINVCTLCAVVHHFFSKAPDCMMSKICGQSPVFGILKAAYTPNSCLAFLGGTREKVTQLATMILNGNIIQLEEQVDG